MSDRSDEIEEELKLLPSQRLLGCSVCGLHSDRMMVMGYRRSGTGGCFAWGKGRYLRPQLDVRHTVACQCGTRLVFNSFPFSLSLLFVCLCVVLYRYSICYSSYSRSVLPRTVDAIRFIYNLSLARVMLWTEENRMLVCGFCRERRTHTSGPAIASTL